MVAEEREPEREERPGETGRAVEETVTERTERVPGRETVERTTERESEPASE